MKYTVLFLGLLATATIISCHSNDYSSKDDAVVASDTAAMAKDGTMNTTTSAATTAGADSGAAKVTAVTMAKPDPSKKGMKVKVMVTLPMMGQGEMVADKEGYYANTEVLPAFPGGQKELQRFFEKNLLYPADAEDNGIEGTVNLNFAVDENGKIYAPIITSPNVGYGVEQEALRVFSKMPAWTPGRIKGKNVKTRFTLPVTFKMY